MCSRFCKVSVNFSRFLCCWSFAGIHYFPSWFSQNCFPPFSPFFLIFSPFSQNFTEILEPKLRKIREICRRSVIFFFKRMRLKGALRGRPKPLGPKMGQWISQESPENLKLFRIVAKSGRKTGLASPDLDSFLSVFFSPGGSCSACSARRSRSRPWSWARGGKAPRSSTCGKRRSPGGRARSRCAYLASN